jgi:hypothetical protein
MNLERVKRLRSSRIGLMGKILLWSSISIFFFFFVVKSILSKIFQPLMSSYFFVSLNLIFKSNFQIRSIK